MLPAKKRFKLLLLASFFLLFGIEENYCSDNVGGNENFEGQHVGQAAVQNEIIPGGKVFLSFFSLFIVPNFSYWLFDLYQSISCLILVKSPSMTR